MPFKHVPAPLKGMITNIPSTLLPPEASPYIRGMYLRDGEIRSDFGHSDFPVTGNTTTNMLHGTVMMIDQFYMRDGKGYLYAFTTTNAYWFDGTTWQCITPGTTVEDCEDEWTASTDVSCAVSSTYKLRGSYSADVSITAAFGTGVAAYENFAAKDVTDYTALHFWVRSTVATATNQIGLRISEATAGGTGATYENFLIPALTANTWTSVCIDFVTPGYLNAALSVSLIVTAAFSTSLTVYIDDVRAVKRFTGDEDNRFSTATMNDTFIATNGVDRPQKITVSSGVSTMADLTTTLAAGTISTAEIVFSFKDHLFLMNNTENAADCPQRVSWTNIGATEDFVIGTAGYQDLVDEESWVMAAEQIGENEVVIYKERSIVIMMWVGGHTPFRLWTMVDGTGTNSKEGVANVGGEHIVLGPDVVYSYKGEREVDILSDAINRTMYDRINKQYINRSFLCYVEEDDELQIWIPTDTAYPDDVWCVDVSKEPEIWYRKSRTMMGFGYYEEQSSFTIGDLVGTIGEQHWRFGDALTKSHTPITLVGDTNGKVYKLDKMTLNNDGSAITNEFETPDFVLPDTEDYMNKFMRVPQLVYEAKGQSVTTSWSDNGGTTWNPTSGDGVNTVSLVSAYEVYQQDFDTTVRKIRFRFRNTIASSGFGLRYYGFYWMLRSGRR